MTTLVQNLTQVAASNPYFDTVTGLFGSMENSFRITEVRETQREATHSFPRRRPSKSSEDDLDAITQAFGDWSLFGRSKEEVIFNPSFQLGLNIQFKEFVDCEDGLVPVVTLDDIKGSKVIISSPPYDTENSYSPGGPDPTMGFSIPLSHSASVTHDLSLVHTAFDVPPDGTQGTAVFVDRQRVLPQLVNPIPSPTETSTALYNHLIFSDAASSARTNLEQVNNKTARDVPTLHLNLQGISNNLAFTYTPALSSYHTNSRGDQVAGLEERNNPLLSQALLDSWNAVPSNSSVQYPFEQTPAPAKLPFPIKSPVHSSQPIDHGSQNIQQLFGQQIHDTALENPLTDTEPQSHNQYDNSFSLSCWPSPPDLSPCNTDVSQDSNLYTPISSLSPMPLSFVASSQPVTAAAPYQHPLPSQDVLTNVSCVNPAFLTLNDIHLGEPFPPYVAPDENTHHRTTQRTAQRHEVIMVQVAPYPIGPLTSKLKTATHIKDKGKVNAKTDEDDGSDGIDMRAKARQKRRKRDEADKVRCEIDGCSGTFFSNWELKRHQRNLHGTGEDTPNTAVCPKCGRHFMSRRKDSVDRHLELNACGKRNPRKSPKRFRAGQGS